MTKGPIVLGGTVVGILLILAGLVILVSLENRPTCQGVCATPPQSPVIGATFLMVGVFLFAGSMVQFARQRTRRRPLSHTPQI